MKWFIDYKNAMLYLKKNMLGVHILNLFFFSCVMHFSCADAKNIENNSSRDSIKFSRKNTSLAILPFGCPILVIHKFPKGWEKQLDDNSSKKTHVNLHQKALEMINDFYYKLAKVKSIKSPFIKQTKYIIIDGDSTLISYEQHFNANFKYKLPNFGPFQCYYQYFEVPMPYYYKLEGKANSFDKLYFSYGNLVLYDPKTKEAKILNIYNSYDYRQPTVGFNRYFYIGSDKVIRLYEAGDGESGSAISKTQEITIKSDGQVSTKNIK